MFDYRLSYVDLWGRRRLEEFQAPHHAKALERYRALYSNNRMKGFRYRDWRLEQIGPNGSVCKIIALNEA